MDPMEFRILNAYRDGDMKAHRREAKGTALIECVQVAAEKAKWPIREEFRRMSSRQGGARAPRRRRRASHRRRAGPRAHALRTRAGLRAAAPRARAAAPTGARAWRDPFLLCLWREEALR